MSFKAIYHAQSKYIFFVYIYDNYRILINYVVIKFSGYMQIFDFNNHFFTGIYTLLILIFF